MASTAASAADTAHQQGVDVVVVLGRDKSNGTADKAASLPTAAAGTGSKTAADMPGPPPPKRAKLHSSSHDIPARKGDRGAGAAGRSAAPRGAASVRASLVSIEPTLSKIKGLVPWALAHRNKEAQVIKKVQRYLLLVGDHITQNIATEERAAAWAYAAERAECRINAICLSKLYADIKAT